MKKKENKQKNTKINKRKCEKFGVRWLSDVKMIERIENVMYAVPLAVV